MPVTFITGPVRSGKSRFAERCASASERPVTYVATARRHPGDAEWSARIAHHAATRPPEWTVVETGADGAPGLVTLVATASPSQTLLVDSLGTWLDDRFVRRFGNGDFDAGRDADALEAECDALVDALLNAAAHAIVVGEEVGWGIVPAYPSARAFRDLLGRAQQRLATRANAAFLVVAGFAIDLHAAGTPIAMA